MKAAFLIAAPLSGSGKTTIARGLMALFAQQGYRVQPFKCGPDYIDTKFHQAVCGRPSINLDTFMATEAHVQELFERYCADADIAIVEGMMGMYDGYSRELGSSADIARVLGLPVVLVVDARSAAFSTAALLSGFIGFRAHVRVAGVIFNKVGSGRHAQLLREAAAEVGVPCLGCIPKQEALEQGSRYLGLDFSGTACASTDAALETIGASIGRHLDMPQLLRLTAYEAPLAPPAPPRRHLADSRILIARNNEAFSFLYQETIDELSRQGDVTFFDPTDEAETSRLQEMLPMTDVLYLPGGYPEKHLEALVRAEKIRYSIREYAESGGCIIAECGGMMFLCERIVTDNGEYPMCGVLPYSISARKADRHLSLGYRCFKLEGEELRGHEFHYTQFLGETPPSITQVFNAKGEPVPTPVFRYKNVLASYTHLYRLPSCLK